MTDSQQLPEPKDLSGVPDLTVNIRDPKEKVAVAVEEVWQRVWLPILEEAKAEGSTLPCIAFTDAQLKQLKLELHDAYTLYSSLNYLYSELSGGMISKPYTHPHHVIEAAKEHYEGWCAQDIVEELEMKIEADDEEKSPEFYEGIAVAIDIIKKSYPQAFER